MNLLRRRGVDAKRTISGAFNPATITTWHSLMWAENPGQSFTPDALTAQWDDMSGNGRHVANVFGDAFSPRYRASVAGLNNKPAIHFDGGDFLSSGFTTLTQPYSLAFIGAMTSRASGGVVGIGGGTNDGFRSDIFAFSDNTWCGYAGSLLAGGTADALKHLWTLDVNGGSSVLKVDGSTIASGAAGSQCLNGFIVGSLFSLNFPLNGHIALAGIKSSALFTSGEHAALLAGSRSHYGTP